MLNTFQVFDVRTDLAYKGYRFESRYDINPPFIVRRFYSVAKPAGVLR